MIRSWRVRLRVWGRIGLRPTGPIAQSMAASLQRTLLLGLLGWNVILVLVVVAAPTRLPTALMAAVHLVAIGVLAMAVRGRIPATAALVALYPVWLLDYLAARTIDDAIALAACWLGDLLYLASALGTVTRARTWLPVLGSTAVVAVLVAVSPVWTLPVASAFVVTAVTVVAVARVAMPSLWRLAEGADESRRALDERRASQTAVREAGAEAAEDARVLHDTVINTLALIATGTDDDAERQARIRARCAEDLRVVRALLDRRPRATHRLRDLAATTEPISVTRIGPDDTELDELEESLPPRVVAALDRSVGEALRNVSKHARVPEARVEIRIAADHLRVEVSDAGLGFDPTRVHAGSGISESIRRRMSAVGGTARIETRPGEGTRVSLRYDLADRPSPDPGEAGPAPDVVAARLIRRACWLLGGGIVAVGVVIEVANRPGRLTWTYAMLALVALGLGTAAVAVRRRTHLPSPVAGLLAAVLPIAFLAALAGIDLGRSEVIYLQAIGVSPLLMVLILLARPGLLRVAIAAQVATALVVALIVGRDDVQYATVVLVGTAPSLLVGTAWWGFVRLVRRIVVQGERLRAQAVATEIETAVEQEITVARRLWGVAGLERAAALLDDIATGAVRPDDPEVRAACAAEETYLRQLLLLSPAAYRISIWFARALARARQRGVHLVLRSGDHDALDAATAEAVGRVVLDAVDTVPAGRSLTVSWFLSREESRLFLVAEQGSLSADGADALRARVPSGWDWRFDAVDDQELVEVLVRSGAAVGADG